MSASYQKKWFHQEGNACANALQTVVLQLERQSASRRRDWLLDAILVNGPDVPMSLGLSMSNSLVTLDTRFYSPPYFTVAAQAIEVLSNRIGSNKPGLWFLPQGGDHRTRTRCKRLSKYMDGLFAQLEVYKTTRLCFRDALTFGIAFAKVFEGLDGEIKIERVMCDDVFVDLTEVRAGSQPRNLYQRTFFSREDLLAAYPDVEDQAAIIKAPVAFRGVHWTSSQSEQVALIEAFHLPSYGEEGKPEGGRHVISVGNHVLYDEEWTLPRFPLAILRYQPANLSFYSQSLPASIATVQQDISKTYETIREAQDRVAVPRVLVHTNSGVTAQSLANRIGALVPYKGTAPQFVTPPAMPPEIYQWLETDIQRAFKRVGISEQSAGGLKQPGLQSGAALRTFSQIEDARFQELGEMLEEFIADIGVRVLDLAKQLKPRVSIPGHRGTELKWSEVELPDDQYVSKVFPISQLPQLPAGRLETINNWFQAGQITKSQKMRLEGLPDIEAFTNLADAAQDWVEDVLDRMIETGEYITPEPYADLQLCIETGQARFLYESTLKLPEDRLDLIRRFIDEAKDLKQSIDAQAQPPQPGNDNGQAQSAPPQPQVQAA